MKTLQKITTFYRHDDRVRYSERYGSIFRFFVKTIHNLTVSLPGQCLTSIKQTERIAYFGKIHDIKSIISFIISYTVHLIKKKLE
jgi:hypothetical protein